nr:MAG TPA: hypothetical protein [Caudoviricetes sp.]DAY44715.1 MAG TPA: hypothetical protein [Caudoviricetes sp.]
MSLFRVRVRVGSTLERQDSESAQKERNRTQGRGLGDRNALLSEFTYAVHEGSFFSGLFDFRRVRHLSVLS